MTLRYGHGRYPPRRPKRWLQPEDFGYTNAAEAPESRAAPPSLFGPVPPSQPHSGGIQRAVAFDLSLTASGWAGRDQSGVLKPPKSHAAGLPRLCWIRDAVLSLCRAVGAQLVILEGYSYASKTNREVLGELGGVVRIALFEASFPLAVVPPSTLKKFATGAGNVGKDAVLAAAIRRLGYAGSDHNEADALWLHAAALEAYGAPAVELPKVQREAVKAIAWPTLANGGET